MTSGFVCFSLTGDLLHETSLSLSLSLSPQPQISPPLMRRTDLGSAGLSFLTHTRCPPFQSDDHEDNHEDHVALKQYYALKKKKAF